MPEWEREIREALAGTNLKVDAAREAYRQARAGARVGLIRTPIDGTVLALNAQPGQEVGRLPVRELLP